MNSTEQGTSTLDWWLVQVQTPEKWVELYRSASHEEAVLVLSQLAKERLAASAQQPIRLAVVCNGGIYEQWSYQPRAEPAVSAEVEEAPQVVIFWHGAGDQIKGLVFQVEVDPETLVLSWKEFRCHCGSSVGGVFFDATAAGYATCIAKEHEVEFLPEDGCYRAYFPTGD